MENLQKAIHGSKTTAEVKEQNRREKQHELGVCRIRRSEGDTLGSGFVVKQLQIIPGFPRDYCLISSDKVFPKDELNIKSYYLDFRKLDSTKLKTIKLEDIASESTDILRTSGLVVIPIDPSKKCTKKESIFTYRPFKVANEGIKPVDDLCCHYVNDLSTKLFDVKWLKVQQADVPGQYELHEGLETPYKTYAEVTHKGDRKPYGAVILKRSNNEFMVAGALTFTDDECKNISPVFFPLPLPPPQGPQALNIKIDVETMKLTEHNTQDRTPVSRMDSGRSADGRHQEASSVPGSSAHTQPSCTGAEALQAPNRIPTEGEVLRLIALNYLQTTPPRCKDDHDHFYVYMEKMKCLITGVSVGSLLITVKCDSLQILEGLWEDYSSGNLDEVVQRCFVTEEILREFSLAELKLKTTILEEEYKACKVYFEKNTARGQLCEIVAASDVTEKPGHFTDEKISTETDNKETDNKEDLPTETDGENTKFKPVEDDSVSADEDKCESVAVPEEEPVNFVREEILKEVDDNYDLEEILKVFIKNKGRRTRETNLEEQSWPDQVHRIVYAGLEMFDVSSPKGLQDYLIYFYDWMYSEGLRLLRGYNSSRETPGECEAALSTGSDLQGDEKEASTVLVQKTAKPGKESPSVKNLTKVMDDDLEQFVSIHVKEGAWQVVVWVFDELLHRGVPSSIISAAKREGWETNDDAESDDSQLVALTWWPTNEDQELVTLCKVLTESDCKLISLNLSFNFKITDAGVNHLAEALMHSNCKLNNLDLSCNQAMTDAGVKHLAEALMHTNCNLNSLDLSDNNDAITDAAVKHLAEALMHSNCSLNSLDLRHNKQITDAGVKHLAEALMHSNCSLNSLNLSDNDAITDAGVKHLAEALMHSNCSLNSLNLSLNDAITDAGVKHLAEALMHSNRKLNSLNLSWNRNITDAGVKHLAEALMHSNCKLKRLNLSGNKKKTDAGVEHLAEALVHSNCSLNSLDLSWNDAITDAGVKHLAEALMHSNCSLNSLNLSDNYRITDAGVKHLAEALMHSNYELGSRNYADIIVTAKVKEHVSEEGLG